MIPETRQCTSVPVCATDIVIVLKEDFNSFTIMFKNGVWFMYLFHIVKNEYLGLVGSRKSDWVCLQMWASMYVKY